ncbi:hypothetical protein CHH78_04365 [Shouchella clausii]|uniref:Uncharacterized protein n=1 Tax=Shouchella clausii TaxID=79880 RepID=A0A268S3A8_SHOCL|nr:hypothetical protein CHH54_21000 [Bacillus sp. 7520-S]PAD93442.1 hypothetical protein CHH52_04820 [Shouchella clausii]PAE85765.1 hypothetical protein CHH78_04365 [Shouchella clausii]PAF06501.1 hypothetical protein CHH66_04360 [Shouchella clausii]PAF15202.1 hypothetical protein CHH59_04995 [Shouchella clausii]
MEPLVLSFVLMLLLFAAGIPLLLILILHYPLIGACVIAFISINWFIAARLHRKHERMQHAGHDKNGL